MKTAEILRELFKVAEAKSWIMEFDTSNKNQEYEDIIILTPAWSSPDLQFCVDVGENIDNFLRNLYSVYIDFDPSDEAYEWFGDMGYGDEAPYDMENIYDAMNTVKNAMYNLYVALKEMYRIKYYEMEE